MTSFDAPSADQSEAGWRTRLDPARTKHFGVTECHAVAFAARDDRGGCRHSVIIEIPETAAAYIADALRWARKRHARLIFLCDTAGQATEIADRVRSAVPTHRRIPLERALVGAWGLPS